MQDQGLEPVVYWAMQHNTDFVSEAVGAQMPAAHMSQAVAPEALAMQMPASEYEVAVPDAPMLAAQCEGSCGELNWDDSNGAGETLIATMPGEMLTARQACAVHHWTALDAELQRRRRHPGRHSASRRGDGGVRGG